MRKIVNIIIISVFGLFALLSVCLTTYGLVAFVSSLFERVVDEEYGFIAMVGGICSILFLIITILCIITLPERGENKHGNI